ncbi:uncharacterized protein N7518_000284 [Penicillium psychrosexuale]|uniref:uncharacterized protein n=1 Tax=Penicillium psychrosexuale TaxID=1002107 RepID=UPI0025459AB9|nr:uncharacterized protein N7518_000284 [Penicillium psychrosexuale]KAJ5803981.1 hypothetical protein N7518_000284 [Penicillium psychrosexuale]
MDITRYMVDAAGIQALSRHQIATFFDRNKPITQESCDETAALITRGGPVVPTPAQGMTSYTVIAGINPKAIQFCAPEAALDMKVMALAKSMYKDFAPGCEKRDSLGPLIVYEMDVVEGVAFSIAQRDICAINKYSLLERTVQDLAKFFALSWTSGIDMTLWIDTAVTSVELSQRLENLADALPERFRAKLIEVRDQLPLLFALDYPQVLNHADLWEMNIHVNASTGGIAGIVDWHDATVGPFGLSFWGLETLLGTFVQMAGTFMPVTSNYGGYFGRPSMLPQALSRSLKSGQSRLEGSLASSRRTVSEKGYPWRQET